MDDLISRKALLEAMSKWARENFSMDDEYGHIMQGMEKAVDLIEEQPIVDRWIPCSERLPKDGSIPYWTTHEDGSVVMHWYSKERGFIFNWEVDDLEKRKRQGRVIAWMPILLPEPYKAGDIDG